MNCWPGSLQNAIFINFFCIQVYPKGLSSVIKARSGSGHHAIPAYSFHGQFHVPGILGEIPVTLENLGNNRTKITTVHMENL